MTTATRSRTAFAAAILTASLTGVTTVPAFAQATHSPDELYNSDGCVLTHNGGTVNENSIRHSGISREDCIELNQTAFWTPADDTEGHGRDIRATRSVQNDWTVDGYTTLDGEDVGVLNAFQIQGWEAEAENAQGIHDTGKYYVLPGYLADMAPSLNHRDAYAQLVALTQEAQTNAPPGSWEVREDGSFDVPEAWAINQLASRAVVTGADSTAGFVEPYRATFTNPDGIIVRPDLVESKVFGPAGVTRTVRFQEGSETESEALQKYPSYLEIGRSFETSVVERNGQKYGRVLVTASGAPVHNVLVISNIAASDMPNGADGHLQRGGNLAAKTNTEGVAEFRLYNVDPASVTVDAEDVIAPGAVLSPLQGDPNSKGMRQYITGTAIAGLATAIPLVTETGASGNECTPQELESAHVVNAADFGVVPALDGDKLVVSANARDERDWVRNGSTIIVHFQDADGNRIGNGFSFDLSGSTPTAGGGSTGTVATGDAVIPDGAVQATVSANVSIPAGTAFTTEDGLADDCTVGDNGAMINVPLLVIELDTLSGNVCDPRDLADAGIVAADDFIIAYESSERTASINVGTQDERDWVRSAVVSIIFTDANGQQVGQTSTFTLNDGNGGLSVTGPDSAARVRITATATAPAGTQLHTTDGLDEDCVVGETGAAFTVTLVDEALNGPNYCTQQLLVTANVLRGEDFEVELSNVNGLNVTLVATTESTYGFARNTTVFTYTFLDASGNVLGVSEPQTLSNGTNTLSITAPAGTTAIDPAAVVTIPAGTQFTLANDDVDCVVGPTDLVVEIVFDNIGLSGTPPTQCTTNILTAANVITAAQFTRTPTLGGGTLSIAASTSNTYAFVRNGTVLRHTFTTANGTALSPQFDVTLNNGQGSNSAAVIANAKFVDAEAQVRIPAGTIFTTQDGLDEDCTVGNEDLFVTVALPRIELGGTTTPQCSDTTLAGITFMQRSDFGVARSFANGDMTMTIATSSQRSYIRNGARLISQFEGADGNNLGSSFTITLANGTATTTVDVPAGARTIEHEVRVTVPAGTLITVADGAQVDCLVPQAQDLRLELADGEVPGGTNNNDGPEECTPQMLRDAKIVTTSQFGATRSFETVSTGATTSELRLTLTVNTTSPLGYVRNGTQVRSLFRNAAGNVTGAQIDMVLQNGVAVTTVAVPADATFVETEALVRVPAGTTFTKSGDNVSEDCTVPAGGIALLFDLGDRNVPTTTTVVGQDLEEEDDAPEDNDGTDTNANDDENPIKVLPFTGSQFGWTLSMALMAAGFVLRRNGIELPELG